MAGTLLIIFVFIFISSYFILILKRKLQEPRADYKFTFMTIDDSVIANSDSFTIIQPVWWSANIYETIKVYDESLSPYSIQQRYLLAINWYIAEVNNGGHDQYYFNSTGITWPDVIAGLEAIGAEKAIEIMQKSIDMMGGKPSRARKKRQEYLDKNEVDFYDLDERFYKQGIDGYIEELMVDYARKYAESFYFDGKVKVPKNWKPREDS